MKKYILSLIALALVASSYAQTLSFTKGNNLNFGLEQSGVIDCKIYFKNITGKSLNLKYKKIDSDLNAGWTVTLCDNFNCVANLPDSGDYYPVAIDETTEMKISINTNGIADTCTVKYAIYNVETPTQVDTLTFNFVLKWNLSAASAVFSNVSIFPNPASSNIHITGIENADYVISDITGKQVMAGAVYQNTTVNTQGLKGFYFVTIAKNNELFTQKLVVE